jgi:HK97 family phage portal protein
MKGDTPFVLPAWADNPEPERYSSWVELMLEAVNSLQTRGECFTYVTGRYQDGWPSRFVVLPADSMQIELDGGHREFYASGVHLDRGDVCFIRSQCVSGRERGISPLEWIASSLTTSGALERYAVDLAARGGVPWAALTVPGFLSDDQAKDARDRWLRARWDAQGAPAMLSGGATLQPLTFSPKDMALLELREFDERRVCGAFGVPSFLVNVSQATGLTYANATALFDHHWRATLRPLADLIARGWSQFLLPRGQRFEFNPDRYVQPALGERVAAWMTMHGIQDDDGTRAMDVPEIRAAERLGPAAPPTSAPVAPDAQLMTGAAL